MVASHERLKALDVFRGITVAFMFIVNNPGNWDSVYPAFLHSEWHGCTAADLVFPFFLFIVGVTSFLSLQARQAKGVTSGVLRAQILKRAATLFLIGITITWFTGYGWDGLHELSFSDFIAERFRHWRFPGVLQRIGIVYGVVSLLGLHTGPKTRITVIVSLLFGYWAALMAIPVPETGATGLAAITDPTMTNAAWADRLFFDWGAWGQHMWRESKVWDPEGILSTLPAIATGLLGLEAGRWMARPLPLTRRLQLLALAGVAGIAAGYCWDIVFPMNKALWTSSYVLFTAGLAAVSIAALTWLIDVRKSQAWTPFFLAFGMNPILAYVADETFGTLIYSVVSFPGPEKRVSLVDLAYDRLFLPFLSPEGASLAFALANLTLWYVVLDQMYRRKIILKI